MADNPKQQQIRRPGSQVAPGQKPFFRPGQTASTHSRIPVDQATAGKLYRVRDKADANGIATIWGENLPHAEALRLKEQVVAARRSRTARVEEMTAEEIAAAQVDAQAPEPATAPPPTEVDYTTLSNIELVRELGDDPRKWAIAFAQHAQARGIIFQLDDVGFFLAWFGNAIESRPRPKSQTAIPADPVLADAQRKALAAAAPAARQAQIRHDKTRATAPAPKRVTIPAAPPTPPPSPLSDEVIEDGPAELPPDDETMDSADLADLSAEIGGGPSDDDRQRAKAQADLDIAEMTQAAIGAYDAATASSDGGPWPTWEQLGEFEHAAWRYYVSQGGDPPELVKTPRKVAHAMGQVS